MRPLPSALILALALLGPGRPETRAGFSLFRNDWGNVLVSTDMTPEGRTLTPPSRENPVYYRGRSLGPKLGTIPGDRLPAAEEVNRFITRVLAQQGYVGASPGVHEPSLYLVVQWGYLDPRHDDLLWFLGYDEREDPTAEEAPHLRAFRSREIEAIMSRVSEPLYGIIVSAFEYKTARTPNPVIYWQTRIGLPADGKSMASAVPVMIFTAGPLIGQESKKPVLLDTDAVREGRVRLGELQIIDVLNEAPAAPEKK